MDLMLPDQVAKVTRVKTVTWSNTATTTATVAERPIWVAPQDVTIVGANFTANTTVTPAAGSNSQTLVVTGYTAAGVSLGTVASVAIANATPATQNVPLALTLTSTVAIASGRSLTIQSLMVGTATVPVGTLTISYQDA